MICCPKIHAVKILAIFEHFRKTTLHFGLKNDEIPNVVFFNTGFHNPTDLKYGSAAYYKYMKYRSDLILKLLAAEVSLFVVEADATWYGDPGESLAKFENMDFVAGQDGGLKDEKIECGFLFMNATENAKTTHRLKTEK